jgi:hypothetical protein
MKRILMATVIGALVASTATLSSPPAAMNVTFVLKFQSHREQ